MVIDQGPWLAISQGSKLTCGLKTDGSPWCWGDLTFGGATPVTALAPQAMLFNTTSTNSTTNETTTVTTSLSMMSISVGAGYACGVTKDGQGYCFGDNSAGQLGDGTTTSSSLPVLLPQPPFPPPPLPPPPAPPPPNPPPPFKSPPPLRSPPPPKEDYSGNSNSDYQSPSPKPDYESPSPNTDYQPPENLYYDGPPSPPPAGDYSNGSGTPPVARKLSRRRRVHRRSLLQEGQPPAADAVAPAAAPTEDGAAAGTGEIAPALAPAPGPAEIVQSPPPPSPPPPPPSTWVYLSASQADGQGQGGKHTCGLTSDARIVCWGDNTYGQLGDGTETSTLSPTESSGNVVVLVNNTITVEMYWKAVSTGPSYSCGVNLNGTLYCWGKYPGLVAPPKTTTKPTKPSPTAILQASGGGALRPVALDGVMVLLKNTTAPAPAPSKDSNGDYNNNNDYGSPSPSDYQGRGDTNNGDYNNNNNQDYNGGGGNNGRRKLRRSLLKVNHRRLQSTTTSISISAPLRRSRDLLQDYNNNNGGGDYNNNDYTPPPPPPGKRGPGVVGSGGNWTSITTGTDHVCGIQSDSSAWCFGLNTAGALGINSTKASPVAAKVGGTTPGTWLSISAGMNHTCGIKQGGVMYCWGNGTLGALGTGDVTNALLPAPVQTEAGMQPWGVIESATVPPYTPGAQPVLPPGAPPPAPPPPPPPAGSSTPIGAVAGGVAVGMLVLLGGIFGGVLYHQNKKSKARIAEAEAAAAAAIAGAKMNSKGAAAVGGNGAVDGDEDNEFFTSMGKDGSNDSSFTNKSGGGADAGAAGVAAGAAAATAAAVGSFALLADDLKSTPTPTKPLSRGNSSSFTSPRSPGLTPRPLVDEATAATLPEADRLALSVAGTEGNHNRWLSQQQDPSSGALVLRWVKAWLTTRVGSAHTPPLATSSSKQYASLGKFEFTWGDVLAAQPLGMGSFGEVFLATWKEGKQRHQDRRLTALKVLVDAKSIVSQAVEAAAKDGIPLGGDTNAIGALSPRRLGSASGNNLSTAGSSGDMQANPFILRTASGASIGSPNELSPRFEDLVATAHTIAIVPRGALLLEAAALANITHPNIVGFEGICLRPPALAFEFCPRGSLYNLLHAGKRGDRPAAGTAQLTWLKTLKILLDAASGMHYIHSQRPQLVHKDLTSNSILLTEDWTVKIADAGLRSLTEAALGKSTTTASSTQEPTAGSASASSSSSSAANPRWQAPEVMEGRPPSTSSDVFAFGIIMWELLTWQLPWPNVNPWSIVGLVLSGARPLLPTAEGLPTFAVDKSMDRPGLEEYLTLMQKCWSQRPAQRPKFKEIVEVLQSLTTSQ